MLEYLKRINQFKNEIKIYENKIKNIIPNDGIYNNDPVKNLNAKIYKKIKYHEVISKNLRVMDTTSISLAKESNIPILITNIFKKNSILNALNGKGVYSIIN